MKIGVTHKLFIAILAAAALSLFSSVLIMQWSISRGFLKFVNSVEQAGVSRLAVMLEEFYGVNQNWDLLKSEARYWDRLIAASLPDAGHPRSETAPAGLTPDKQRTDESPPERIPNEIHVPMPPHVARDFYQRLYLLDSSRNILIKHGEVTADSSLTPLMYRGKTVGYLGLSHRKTISDAPQQRFMREQKSALVLTAGVVVILAAALSLFLARLLVKPLDELAQATHQLAAGSYSIRVSAQSHDELGELARDFNALALALEQGELSRRQWAADISHELRTPLAILRGEIEAIQDGVRQATEDKINSLHAEVMQLVRLVDDLYQLSLSDVGGLTYKKTGLDLAEVLDETVANFTPEFISKNIAVGVQYPENGSAPFFGDGKRLQQLFSNLLDNSLKYTDPGGELQITLKADQNRITVDFKDSAPDVAAPDLCRLFERLYRVESSRNRSSGGAGLGLAICRNITEAHSGSISAQYSELGGLWIKIELPGVES